MSHISYVNRDKPTEMVRSERVFAVLLMAYGGLSRSSPTWLGAPRFASFELPKIVLFGLGTGEVRLGGTPLAMA